MSTLKSSAENLTLNADGANNDIILQSNGSTKVTLDGQNTRLGIGTATPLATVHASEGVPSGFSAADGGADELLISNSSSEVGMTIASTTVGTINFADGGATRQGRVRYEHDNDKLELWTNNTENLSIDSSGNTTITTGDIVFGTAGKGICLGVTSNTDANTLDDYEEGSWTPGFATGTPTYTTTYARTGQYTKIGNVCHVTMEMYMGDISFSDATANMTFSGLPFAATSSGATFGIAIASHVQLSNIYTHGVTYNNLGEGNDGLLNFQPGIAASATQFVMDVSPFNNSVRGHLKNAAFHNGSGLVVGLTYRTA